MYLSASSIIDFSATCKGLDSVNFQVTDNYLMDEAQKVEYSLTMTNPAIGIHRNFVASVWFVKNVGIVKMEGSDEVLSLFSGGSFPFSITTYKGLFVETLTKY